MSNALYLSLICTCLAAGSVLSQPAPKITSLSLEWLQRGATNEISISGENLALAESVHVSGDPGLNVSIERPDPRTSSVKLEASAGGIRAGNGEDAKNIRARIAVAPDASLNAREFRVVTPAGISNPIRVNVSALPEILRDQNSDQPQKLALPVGVSGVIATGGETHAFQISARKGEELVAEILAFRAGSPLDSSLVLLNAAGQEVARSEDARGFDSFIRFVPSEDGLYTLQLRDFRYQGGGNYKYHLTVGTLPCVETVFPAGAARGQTVDVRLRGCNLGGFEKAPLAIASDAPLGWQEIRLQTPGGLTATFPFNVSNLPEVTESEPNNAAGQAKTIITGPTVINGRIGEAKDVDVFKIKLSKAQTLICEVTSQRLGAPLDATLTLRDASGKVVQENDDAEGADARIEAAFAQDVEYTLALRDLLGRGGDSFVYRLSIRPPEPDLQVRFTPDAPRIRCGGRTTIRCELERKAGFAGPVSIRCEGLPAGITAEPLLLTPEDPANGIIVLRASTDAVLPGTHAFKVAATGLVDGKPLVRYAEPMAGETAAKQAFLTVLDKPAPFTVELLTLSAHLEQDQSAVLDVLVNRQPGFEGEIKLTPEGYSSGREPLTRSVDVQPVTIKSGESRGRLTLKARLDSEIGTRPIYVRGEASAEGQPVVEFSEAIPLQITQLPFTITTTLKRLSVAVLPPGAHSAASEAEFAVRATRRGWFTDQINLSVEGLPEGITITSTNLPPHAGEATYKLVSTDKAPAGKDFQLTVTGSASVGGRNYQQRAAPITLSVTKPTDVADAR